MAEGAPLLREYVVKSRIEGSNPSVSSKCLISKHFSGKSGAGSMRCRYPDVAKYPKSVLKRSKSTLIFA